MKTVASVMTVSRKRTLHGATAFSESLFAECLRTFDLPALSIHGDAGPVAAIAAGGMALAKHGEGMRRDTEVQR